MSEICNICGKEIQNNEGRLINDFLLKKNGEQIPSYAHEICCNDRVKDYQINRELEKQRIEGVLLGLSIAKKAWDKGLGRNEICFSELHYNSELLNLNQ